MPGSHFVRVMPQGAEESFADGFLDVEGCNDTNRLDLFVFGQEDHLMIAAIAWIIWARELPAPPYRT